MIEKKKEVDNPEGLTIIEYITSTLLFGFGMVPITRGVYWMINPYDEVQMYLAMTELMSMRYWSIFFLVGGMGFIIASWLLPKRMKKKFAISLLLGGVITSLAYFTLVVAGFGNSTTWITPLTFAINSGISGMLGFFGGIRLWTIKDS